MKCVSGNMIYNDNCHTDNHFDNIYNLSCQSSWSCSDSHLTNIDILTCDGSRSGADSKFQSIDIWDDFGVCDHGDKDKNFICDINKNCGYLCSKYSLNECNCNVFCYGNECKCLSNDYHCLNGIGSNFNFVTSNNNICLKWYLCPFIVIPSMIICSLIFYYDWKFQIRKNNLKMTKFALRKRFFSGNRKHRRKIKKSSNNNIIIIYDNNNNNNINNNNNGQGWQHLLQMLHKRLNCDPNTHSNDCMMDVSKIKILRDIDNLDLKLQKNIYFSVFYEFHMNGPMFNTQRYLDYYFFIHI